jgi:hypothetical protein
VVNHLQNKKIFGSYPNRVARFYIDRSALAA